MGVFAHFLPSLFSVSFFPHQQQSWPYGDYTENRMNKVTETKNYNKWQLISVFITVIHLARSIIVTFLNARMYKDLEAL